MSTQIKCRIIYWFFVRNQMKCFPGKIWATFTQNLQLRDSTLWSTGSLIPSFFLKDICLHHKITLEFSIFTSMTAAGGNLSIPLLPGCCFRLFSPKEIPSLIFCGRNPEQKMSILYNISFFCLP